MLRPGTGLAAAAFVAAFSLPAAAADLQDGIFDCYIGSTFLGNIRIENGTFAGPAFDGDYEGSYPLEVTGGGTINWGGPLGGMSSGGNTVVATVLKDRGGGRIGFDITLQNGQGNFQSVGCDPE
jgi:hypothetical protein